MNLREFFKPDWRKLILFGIIGFLAGISYQATFLTKTSLDKNNFFHSVILVLNLPFILVSTPNPSQLAGITFIISVFLYWYFWACLITWVYKRWRRK